MSDIFQKMKKYKWWTILIVVCVVGGSAYLIYQKEDATSEQAEPIIEQVTRGDITLTVSGTGQVYAQEQVDLQPQVAGDGLDITEVAVTNDQKVSEGDLIAVLDTTDIYKDIQKTLLSVRSSEIKLKQTSKEFDKQTEDDKYTRQLTEITLAQDQLTLNNAYSDLAEYSIRAPFDGIVTGLDVSVGDSISRDEILASVITEKVKAQISLNEVDAAQVKSGNAATLTFDALDDITAVGTVSKVDTIGVVDQGVVTYDVEISFDSPSELLKPGMSVSVEIAIDAVTDVVLVPVDAVKSGRDGESFVLTATDGGETTRVSVETGLTDDVMIEIISGLTEGQKVVTGSVAKSITSASSASTGSLIPSVTGPGSGGGGGPRN